MSTTHGSLTVENTPLISKVKLPNDATNTTYYIHDNELWDKVSSIKDIVDTLSSYTRYLGVTSTAVTDGGSQVATIGDDVYAKTPTGSQKQLLKGDIVTYNNGEFIFNGTTWQEFGDLSGLGAFAHASQGTASYTPAGSIKGTPTAASATLAATKLDVAMEAIATGKAKVAVSHTTANTFLTGVTPTVTDPTIDVSLASKKYGVSVPANTFVTAVSYSKATSGTVTVNSSATFSGAISAVKTVGGVLNPEAVTVPITSGTTGASLVYGISKATATGGAATVGSTTVYGLSDSTTKYMTTPETLSPSYTNFVTNVTVSTATTTAKNLTMTVADEVLQFLQGDATISVTLNVPKASGLNPSTTVISGTQWTAKAYTVGKSGATTFTQPTITVTPSISNYSAVIPSETFITSVTGAAENIPVSVSGAAVTTSAVSITNTATAATLTSAAKSLALYEVSTGTQLVTGLSTATATGTGVTLTPATATAVTGITYSRPTVSAYAGGSHTHTITPNLTFSGTTATITVNPKS